METNLKRRSSLRWLALFVSLSIVLTVVVHYHFKDYITEYINLKFSEASKFNEPRMKIQAKQTSGTSTRDLKLISKQKVEPTTPKPTERPRTKIVPKIEETQPVHLHKDIEIITKAPPVANPAWASMKTSKGPIDILVYPKNVDTIVSASLLNTGQWEPGELVGMENLFKCDPDLGLVDIGANLGLYVLLGAKYGRQVVGVEPSMDNMGRLLESVYRNHFQNYVTLVHNAVSNRYSTMELTANPWNRGNTVIHDAHNSSFHVQGEFEVVHRLNVGTVKTVLMDDLVPTVKFKRGVLKIDIEGAEPLAFQYSRKFLTELDIPYVFMEWLWVKKDKRQASYLYMFFTDMGFKPFQDSRLNIPLRDNYLSWPTDVFWVRPDKTGPCHVGQASIQTGR